MKYLYYITVTILVLVYKIVGLVAFYLAVPFSKYLRNTIHNYDLQNNQVVKRLAERSPKLLDGVYSLIGYETNRGFITYRKVSKLEYYICLPFWLLLDDDASNSTYSRTHNLTYINGERYAPKFIVDSLKTDYFNHSYFELGDNQKQEFNLFGAIIWNGRNTSYNFNYKFMQISDESKIFLFDIFGLKFGWLDDGVVDGRRYYKHIFGKDF